MSRGTLIHLFCSSLVLGLCAFDLLPESLAHLNRIFCISFVFVGVTAHQVMHVAVPHTTSSTMAHRPFQLDACQECSSNATVPEPSTCRPIGLIVGVYAMHALLDGAILGTMLRRIQGTTSLVVSLAICLMQDSVVLSQRLYTHASRRPGGNMLHAVLCAVACICVSAGIGVMIGWMTRPTSDTLYAVLSVCIGMLLCEAMESYHVHTVRENLVAGSAVVLSAGIAALHDDS